VNRFEIYIAFRFILAMALITVFREQRLDILFKIDPIFTERGYGYLQEKGYCRGTEIQAGDHALSVDGLVCSGGALLEASRMVGSLSINTF
jgi:hypothetical protein